jgi:hypothetical protein
MTKPVPDKAEIALEYLDKLYIGPFERSSRFEAHLDKTGIVLVLERPGDADARKSVHVHFHYALFADMLSDLAKTVSAALPGDTPHRNERAATRRQVACRRARGRAVKTGGSSVPRNGAPTWRYGRLRACGPRAAWRHRTNQSQWNNVLSELKSTPRSCWAL